jgi:hypothetical protein
MHRRGSGKKQSNDVLCFMLYKKKSNSKCSGAKKKATQLVTISKEVSQC